MAIIFKVIEMGVDNLSHVVETKFGKQGWKDKDMKEKRNYRETWPLNSEVDGANKIRVLTKCYTKSNIPCHCHRYVYLLTIHVSRNVCVVSSLKDTCLENTCRLAWLTTSWLEFAYLVQQVLHKIATEENFHFGFKLLSS